MPHNTTNECKGKTIFSPVFDRQHKSANFSQLDARIREVLNEGVGVSGKSREQFSDSMSELIGHAISVHMLNSWLAPGRERSRFPLAYTEAFCQVAGSDALKRLVLGPQLCELLELGERAASILDSKARQRVLRMPAGNLQKEKFDRSCAS